MTDLEKTLVSGVRNGTISRRELVKRAAMAGISLPVVATMLSACGDDGSGSQATTTDAQSVVKGGNLLVGLNDGSASENLDPAKSVVGINAMARAQQAYDRLFDPAPDVTAIPALALEADANATGTVWQLKLRPDVTFHDGKPFGADDVLYTWKYYLDPKTGAGAAQALAPIDLAKTKKVSDLELEVHMKIPTGDFKNLLLQVATQILPDGYSDWKSENGTGPFKLVSYEPGVRVEYERNPDWWGAGSDGKPYLDGVTILTLSDPAARVNALLSGDIHAGAWLPFAQAKQIDGKEGFKLLSASPGQFVPFTMRLDAKPFDDNRVREAFKLAIDREKTVAVAQSGYGEVGNDVPGKGFPSYNDELPQRVYDPEKAKALLKQAGYDSVDVTLPTSSNAAGMLEASNLYKQQAAKAGINITLKKIPADSHFTNDLWLKVPFYVSSWANSFEALATAILLSDAPFNGETAWKKPDWDKQFNKARGTVDTEKRIALYKELQVPIHDEGGYVVWGFSPWLDGLAAKVNGLQASNALFLGDFRFREAWLSS